MIIGVKIWPALFGLRPIDSIAEATIRPCPIALPKAAIPIPMLAASAISPARSGLALAAPAASCAIAISGDASSINEAALKANPNRRIIPRSSLLTPAALRPANHLSHPLPPPASRRSRAHGLLLCLVLVALRELDVAHGQNHEDQRLDHANDRSQGVERQRNEHLGQPGENTQHLVIGEHVGVQTNTERKGPEQVVRQLDRKHQRRQQQNRAEEAAQVMDAVRFKALVDIEGEAYRTEGEGQVRV